MAFTQFTNDMDIIAKLSDSPNVDDGYSAAQLKAKFDEGGKAIKDYINNVLLVEALEKPRFTGLVKSNGRGFVQAQPGVDYVADIPDGSITKEKLDPNLTASFDTGVKMSSTSITIYPEDWDSLTATVSVPNVKADRIGCHVIVDAEDDDSAYRMIDCTVRAKSQGNGTLTFSCRETPSDYINMSILVLEG
jgi:hypothetical protein